MITSKFDTLYNKLISEQSEFLEEHGIISEGFLGSLHEIGNIFGGVGETLVELPQMHFEKAGKALWKSLSAPIGALTELGTPSHEDLLKEFDKAQEIKDTDLIKKTKNEALAEYKKMSCEDLEKKFSNWTESGKMFIQEVKKKVPKENERKEALLNVLAFRANEEKIKKLVKKAEAANAAENEDEEVEEDDTDGIIAKFKAAFIKEYGKGDDKGGAQFEAGLKKGKVYTINLTKGKLSSLKKDKVENNPEKYKKWISEEYITKATAKRKEYVQSIKDRKAKRLADAKAGKDPDAKA